MADPLKMAIHAPDAFLVVTNEDGEELVRIGLDLSLTYGPSYDPDVAARRFWDAFRRHAYTPVAVPEGGDRVRIARVIADWGSPSRRWEDRHPKNQKHWLFVADALMSNHPSIIDPVLAYVRAAKAGEPDE